MRKFFSINALLFLLVCLTAVACGKKESGEAYSKDKISSIIAKADSLLPNYRFVDIDTVFVYYNLAKDYSDEMLRLQGNYENEVKRHQNSIQAFATNVEKKRQNNGYFSEQSLNQDIQQLGNMQENAQKAIANLQNTILIADQQGRQTVTDSIMAFINDYNMTKGYDAIFLKGATLCSNPALDITAEVIEGLNARYNKMK
ncbi:MAG: OmpH family outer membrane protein [Muribaculaceae bacterium]|nr:OmpH family outer membrane protein [Muribaculaceae bacterium]